MEDGALEDVVLRKKENKLKSAFLRGVGKVMKGFDDIANEMNEVS